MSKEKIKPLFDDHLNNNLSKIRNIGIIAHIDAGKTTFTERVLYYSGMIHKIGEVHEGKAVTDSMQQERERGITITSAAITLNWSNHIINLLDTPGHIDFNIQVEMCLSVLDSSVVIIDAAAGVQSQIMCVWNQAIKYNVCSLIFINKMDKDGANFDKAYASVLKKLASNCIYIQYPVINESFQFIGIYDLIERKKYIWRDKNHLYEVFDLDENDKKICDLYRSKMLDKLAYFNDDIMNMLLEFKDDISSSKLKSIIRDLTINLKIYPVLCGSAFHNKGVQNVLDAIISYLPSPLERSSIVKEVSNIKSGNRSIANIDVYCDYKDFIGFVFKVVFDRYSGATYYMRVYSGYLSVGDIVFNSKRGEKVRIQNIYRFFADKKSMMSSVFAGDIVGISIEGAFAGDTLCAVKSNSYYLIAKIDIPEPVVDVSFIPESVSDQDNFAKYIHQYTMEDPTLYYRHNDRESILSGVGKLQIEILRERLLTEKNIKIKLQKPRTAFKRTIRKSVTVEYLHKKQTGGAGQFAGVTITVEPTTDKYKFIDKITKGSIPKQFIPEIDSSCKETLYGDGKAPYIGVSISLIDGRYHPVDSSSIAYYLATRYCLLEALEKCEPILLEPIVLINIVTPSEFMSSIISDLYSKGGIIVSVEKDEAFTLDYRHIIAECPLRNLFDYADHLRSLSKGMAYASMKFSKYEECKEDFLN